MHAKNDDDEGKYSTPSIFPEIQTPGLVNPYNNRNLGRIRTQIIANRAYIHR